MRAFHGLMTFLEGRDYSDVHEDYRHLIDLIRMRDRLAYFACQLAPFDGQKPGDLPVTINERRYGPVELVALQAHDMSLVEYYDLLTDIEVALLDAAARRGIRLKRRKMDEGGDGAGTPSKKVGTPTVRSGPGSSGLGQRS